jgi:hypothetical protein
MLVVLALVDRKDNAAIEHMIPLLAEVPREQLWRLEQVLMTLAGEDAPVVGPGDTAVEREQYRAAWEKWWKQEKGSIDLAKADLSGRMQGLTLITSLDVRAGPAGMNGRVYEVGRDGKVRWEITGLNYPLEAQVVGTDRVLVTEYRGQRVTERNFKGEVLWTHTTTSYVYGAQRLPNGNTLINARTTITEVDRNGKVVFSYRPSAGFALSARRTRNGDLWVLDRTGCVRVDRTGREVQRVNVGALGSTIGTSFDVTPAGNVVVPIYTANRVVEFDPDGKKVWEATCERPTAVMRLPNGNTLVASRYSRQVVELNRSGKVVWQYQSDQATVIQARRR